MARSRRSLSPESTRRRAHLHHRSLKPSTKSTQHHPYERCACRPPPPPLGRRNDFAVAWPTEPATRVTLTGFDDDLSARQLADELERVAGRVWRCRVKTYVTLPESYPDFQLPVAAAAAARAVPFHHQDKPSRLGLVAPHAFVHFERPNAARRAGEVFRVRPVQNSYVLHGRAARPRDGGNDTDTGTRRPMLFPDSRVEVGDVVAPSGTFLVAWRGADDSSASALDFVVDPSAGCCRLLFARDAAFTFPDLRRHVPAVLLCCDVKLEFSVADVAEVLAFEADDSLLLRLSAAPLVSYRTSGDDVRGRVPFHLIDTDDDPWIRTTDVTPSGAIGRCSSYRVSFAARFWPTMRAALEYMERQGVPVAIRDGRCRGFTVVEEPDFGRPMHDAFFSLQHDEGLRFPELYLINVLIHNGIVNPHQLKPEFFSLLRRAGEDVNVAALTELFGTKLEVCNDPCSMLKNAQDRATKNLNLLFHSSSRKAGDYNVFDVRRLIITPTRAHCMPPQVERSNRVMRHYHGLSDRFLRVTFVDEGMLPLNANALSLHVVPVVRDSMSDPSQQMTTVYRRVQTILTEGFTMCGRRYSFLAFSTSQLKQKSAWFFAEDGSTTVASIKEWMGQFPIRNPAKHAARMGLCFTSSYATVTMQPCEVNEYLEDVIHNGYNFSDGIGTITQDLALEIAEMLPLTDNYAPSAYQIRYAGFKGVVAVSPGGKNDGMRMMSLRPSMRKFESAHTVIEVVSWTKFQPAFLNRQIITLLTSLGVPDAVFLQMQEAMLGNLKRILSDSDVAFKVVTNSCPEHGSTAGLMLSAGFAPATEPHLRAMLLAICTSQMQGLLDKSWIFVPKGRWLMGCLDELGILEQGQCFIRVSTPSLNNRYGNHGSIFPSEYKNNVGVIVGTIVMAKNPCLHPGDVRILEAVDVPELHHFVDCLVFPKKGERPHANEASGSDLDGDIYFVTWDENLVPPGRKSCAPMEYSPAKSKQLPREVHQHDTIDFYLESMVNDNLGRICNAHVAHADQSDDGAMASKCIGLAELAAIAVDSAKTGEIVRMPSDLSPKEYPDFMGKEDAISYKSKKILGRLYRSILGENAADFLSQDTCISDENQYDNDLEVPGAISFLEDAWQCKCLYEAQLNTLLNQYGVQSEAELVTGEIWSLVGYNKKYQYQLKERLKYAYSKLHQEFRSIFESIDVSFGDNKNIAYEMKASAWYQVTYHPDFIRLREADDKKTPARLSFAWIAIDYLAQIKKKCHREMEVEEGRSAYIF